jgi:diketogulonate reductase-like aldo/keto reductase
MHETSKISTLGIGTWGLGGFKDFDPSIDRAEQVEAVAYTFNKGVNYAETTLWYANGVAAEILAEGLRASDKNRSDVFISQALYEYDHPTLITFKDEVSRFQEILGSEYCDALTISMKGFLRYGFDDVCVWLEEELSSRRTRYINVTNADKTFLSRLFERFGTKLFGHELHFNFEIREMEDLGILATGTSLGIRTIVAQPLRRNRTALRNWEVLTTLAKTHEATQNQILLAWIIHHGYLPLIKSNQKDHIDENLAAEKVQLSVEDMQLLDEWRPDYTSPEIDWLGTGTGVKPDQLANEFDRLYDLQHLTEESA